MRFSEGLSKEAAFLLTNEVHIGVNQEKGGEDCFLGGGSCVCKGPKV